MTSKTLFSNNDDLSFNNYLKLKKGREMIKKISSNNTFCLNKFINYDTFLTLSLAYYKQINNNKNLELKPPVSIVDSNTSFLNYNLLLSHMKDCTYCGTCKEIYHVFNCKYVQNILYPYGVSIQKRENLQNFYYPQKLYLNNLCKKCPTPNLKPDICCPKPSCSSPCSLPCSSPCSLPCSSPCSCLCKNNNHDECEKYITSIYPSQYNFISEKDTVDNMNNEKYNQEKRMNAYAIYPMHTNKIQQQFGTKEPLLCCDDKSKKKLYFEEKLSRCKCCKH